MHELAVGGPRSRPAGGRSSSRGIVNPIPDGAERIRTWRPAGDRQRKTALGVAHEHRAGVVAEEIGLGIGQAADRLGVGQ